MAGRILHVTRRRTPDTAPGRSATGDAMTLRTPDGLRLSATHLRHATDARALGVVLVHGFSGNHRAPRHWRIAQGLAAHAGVLALDLRGHGGSGGLSTLGDREVLDVEAAVEAMRALGYEAVVTCGWSMGGSTVLRHAALYGGVDAVVSVSAPSRWYVKDTGPMRRLHWLVEKRAGRRVTRLVFRTRLADRWDEPESPVEVVGRITPIPLLLVHGDADAYFTMDHPRALAAAAGDPTELWVVRGFGHAEGAATPQLLDRIGAGLAALVARGRRTDEVGV
jgi:pimeloyl-ACP methyl ester carboxylesterase